MHLLTESQGMIEDCKNTHMKVANHWYNKNLRPLQDFKLVEQGLTTNKFKDYRRDNSDDVKAAQTITSLGNALETIGSSSTDAKPTQQLQATDTVAHQ